MNKRTIVLINLAVGLVASVLIGKSDSVFLGVVWLEGAVWTAAGLLPRRQPGESRLFHYGCGVAASIGWPFMVLIGAGYGLYLSAAGALRRIRQ